MERLWSCIAFTTDNQIVGNALLTVQRRRRITRAQRLKAPRALMDLPIKEDQETSERAWRETIQLADDHGLTLYDAVYLCPFGKSA